MQKLQIEVKPKEWSTTEAYQCGKGGYRIKIGLDGNPFKGILATSWLEGWRDAASQDTMSTRRIDYYPEETFYVRPTKSRGRSNSRNSPDKYDT